MYRSDKSNRQPRSRAKQADAVVAQRPPCLFGHDQRWWWCVKLVVMRGARMHGRKVGRATSGCFFEAFPTFSLLLE